MKVKIYGAGSIGNHLAQASRRLGWDVVVVDRDGEALRRMKEEIYPQRYGEWDQKIELFEAGSEPKGGFDVICLGTPPDVRMSLALEVLAEKPKILQLEKPISGPDLLGVDKLDAAIKDSKTAVVVGYDHVVSLAMKKVEDLIRSGNFGEPLALDVEFRETWKGIFAAHPWLSGPHETYLGFWESGGGASGEHSHATNMWQHLAQVLGLGKVKEVSASMQMVKDGRVDYDRACFLNLITITGFVGRSVHDVITEPVKKQARIQFDSGFLELNVNGWERGDLVRYGNGQNIEEVKIEKTRRDDFYQEMLHIIDILEGRIKREDSPISWQRGLDTMKVIAAAHKSRQEKRSIEVNL